jgi:hypothetical protein
VIAVRIDPVKPVIERDREVQNGAIKAAVGEAAVHQLFGERAGEVVQALDPGGGDDRVRVVAEKAVPENGALGEETEGDKQKSPCDPGGRSATIVRIVPRSRRFSCLF